MRKFLNYLAVFVGAITLIVVYGTWPRKPVEAEVVLVEDEAPIQWSGRVMHVEDIPMTSNVFADNFDVEPDIPVELVRALWAIQEVESGGDPNAIGDRHLRHKAYGVLQIRKPYLDDAMRIAGPEKVREAWGVDRLTMADMRDTDRAWWTAKVYLNHYGERYQDETGRSPTIEVYGRIHNGGPSGWKRSVTNRHARKVMEAAE
jgi:hypothetical protein